MLRLKVLFYFVSDFTTCASVINWKTVLPKVHSLRTTVTAVVLYPFLGDHGENIHLVGYSGRGRKTIYKSVSKSFSPTASLDQPISTSILDLESGFKTAGQNFYN